MTGSDHAAQMLDRFVAAEAIKTLLAKYCRAFDRKDEALFMSIWAEQAAYHLVPRGRASGQREIREFINSVWDRISKSHHHITNPLIGISGDRATATADVIYYRETVDGASALLSGTYDCAFEKAGEDWKVTDLKFAGFDTKSPKFE